MSKHSELSALFHDLLDRHRASRRKAGKGFGKMARAATNAALSEALHQAHRAADKEDDAIDALFDIIDRKSHDHGCDVTEALLDGVKSLTGDLKVGAALDEGLAGAAAMLDGLAVDRLSLLRVWAGRLGHAEALPALERLKMEARGSRDRFATLIEDGPASSSTAGDAPLTPKQAALIGLR